MASSGNFCVMNPLVVGSSNTQSQVAELSRGNLHTKPTINDRYGQALGTHGVKTGKWYTEWYIEEDGYPSWLVGWYHGDQIGIYDGSGVSNVANFCSMGYFTGTYIYLTPFGVTSTSGGASNRQDYSTFTNQGVPTTGDVIMNCMDFDAGKGWWGINNVWGNSGSGAGDPANGTNPNLTWTVADYADYKFPITLNWAQSGYTPGEIVFNAGQDSTFTGEISAGGNADGNGFGDFKYAPPSGFLALCSGNLPISDDIDPAQTDDDIPTKQFDVTTWTGNSSSRTITTNMQPDLVWIKSRSNANVNELYDSTRGATKRLQSNATNAEDTRSSELTGFSSSGFTLGSSTFGGTNYNSYTYVGWSWRANGGTTASNTDGDVTSTVQSNTKAGFSIVQYVGNRSSAGTSTVGHGLGGVPDMFITKPTSHSGRWYVWHTGMSGASYMLELNTNSAEQDKSANGSMSLPTSTVFDITYTEGLGENGETHIGYFWRSIEGYSKFGKYTGNGDADGPFIYTGFRPRLIFVKRIDSTASWYAWDTARSTFNKIDDYIEWDQNTPEETGYAGQAYDFLSNGFKARGNNNIGNSTGGTYIYGAWSDVPFKYNNTF